MTATTSTQPEQARLFTLILLTALSTATLNLFVPSLVNIAQELQAEYSVVILSVGVYLAAMTVVQLVVGPLLAGAAAGISGAAIVALGAPLSMLTGKILPKEGASTVVLFLMLCASLISLATVFWAKQLENGTPRSS